MEKLIAIVTKPHQYSRFIEYQKKLPKPGTLHHLLPSQLETHLNPSEDKFYYSTIITSPEFLTEVMRYASSWVQHIVLLSSSWQHSDLNSDQEELLGRFIPGRFTLSNAKTIRDSHTRREGKDTHDLNGDE